MNNLKKPLRETPGGFFAICPKPKGLRVINRISGSDATLASLTIYAPTPCSVLSSHLFRRFTNCSTLIKIPSLGFKFTHKTGR
jgi:hypothetical protein